MNIPNPFTVIFHICLYLFCMSGVMLVILPGLMIQAWVATILWGWFVIPYFHLAPLSLALALGIRLTIRVLMGPGNEISNKNDGNTMSAKLTHAASMTYVAPFFALLLGYGIHLYL